VEGDREDRSACVEMRMIRDDSERLDGGDESYSRCYYSYGNGHVVKE
jgi:hypothetical protein